MGDLRVRDLGFGLFGNEGLGVRGFRGEIAGTRGWG